MSTPTFDPEDPRLTAYALGETLDPADQAEVETLLQQSPEARAAMKEIKDLTLVLTAEYDEERRTAEVPVSAEVPPNVVLLPTTVRDSRWSWVRPALAAAAMLLAIAVLAYLKPGSLPRQVVVAMPGSKDAAPPASLSATVTEIEPAPTIGEPVQELILPKEDRQAKLAAAPMGTAENLKQLAQAESGKKAQEIPFPVAAAPARRGVVPQNGVVGGVPLLVMRDGRALDKPDVSGFGKDERAKGEATRAQIRLVQPAPGFNTAAYDHLTENPFLTAKENPLSTFSIDVDTASYSNVRRFVESGSLPPPDAVRLEELINYFPYDYAPPTPESGKAFAVHLEAAACPWAPEHRLVRIGIKGREVEQGKRPASNLVFLIDVSGSMDSPERLPLIKRAMSMMVEHLTEKDHVAIVTYAGNSGLVLPSTSGEHKDAILAALDRLEAGGSTNGANGITLAYRVAKENFIKGGTNRVILATDGDFNVGVTSQGELIRLIQNEAKSGVFLSALGVGTDNYKDSTMQKLADKGNGNYNYIDRLEEARKILVDQMGGTLVTIAKDVKIQVEFNPAVVAAYRLIGYEKRMLRKEDFNDDRIDAGEIGAGHSVTALYEVVPVGQPTPGTVPAVDALKYGPPVLDAAAKPEVRKEAETDASRFMSPEMLTVKMRHKAPDAEASERSYAEALTDHGTPDDFAKASADFKFAAAVADFGLCLRDSPHKGNATLGAAVELAQEGKGADAKGYRAEFIELVRRARALKEAQVGSEQPVR